MSSLSEAALRTHYKIASEHEPLRAIYGRRFETVSADCDALVKRAQRLRYQVYCVEHDDEDPDALRESLEEDEHDAHSDHRLLRHLPSSEPIILRRLARIGLHWKPVGPMVDFHGLRQPCHMRLSELLDGLARHDIGMWRVVTSDGAFLPRPSLAGGLKPPAIPSDISPIPRGSGLKRGLEARSPRPFRTMSWCVIPESPRSALEVSCV